MIIVVLCILFFFLILGYILGFFLRLEMICVYVVVLVIAEVEVGVMVRGILSWIFICIGFCGFFFLLNRDNFKWLRDFWFMVYFNYFIIFSCFSDFWYFFIWNFFNFYVWFMNFMYRFRLSYFLDFNVCFCEFFCGDIF